MREETIREILRTLASEYSKNWNQAERKNKTKTWNTILIDVTDEQGMAGLTKALEGAGEFMPPVGKFKQMCLAGHGSASVEDDALEAWSLVMNNLNSWTSPVFKDTSIPEAIRKIGGWKKLCMMETEHEPFRKKEFVDLYVIQRRKKEEFFPRLGGGNSPLKFIGFSSEQEERAALNQIENVNKTECRIIEMMSKRKLKKRRA